MADRDRSRIDFCLPLRLHPFSRDILDLYMRDRIPTKEFLRWFHMPNSDYIPIARCIVNEIDPDYRPINPMPDHIPLV